MEKRSAWIIASVRSTLMGGFCGHQHRVKDLISHFPDGTGKVAQKERVRFVAFAD